jgi:hypothetical protein
MRYCVICGLREAVAGDFCSRECARSSAEYHHKKMLDDDARFEREANSRLISLHGLPERVD